LNTWPQFAQDEIDAATEVLRSGRVNYWTGEQGRLFEQEFASYHGVPHAVALCNGTVALEAALQSLEIGPGDEVVVPPRTYIATAGAVVLRGATPIFADVDAESGNLTAETITPALTARTRAIIVVHLAGWPCRMDPIMELARAYNLQVIEDCAQAHGARHKGRPVGSFGDAAAFSFCQDKIMTTGGEGGMLLLKDEAAWRRAWALKDQGRSYEACYEREHGPGYRWLYESFGTNWRMSEMQAAIGRVQLRKLDGWVEARRRNAAILESTLAGSPGLRVAFPPPSIKHAYYKFYAYVRPHRLEVGWDRDRILAEFSRRGIPALSGTCSEIYLEQCFLDAGLMPKRQLKVAEELGQTSIMLPVHPTLTEDKVRHIGSVVRSVLAEASAGSSVEDALLLEQRSA